MFPLRAYSNHVSYFLPHKTLPSPLKNIPKGHPAFYHRTMNCYVSTLLSLQKYLANYRVSRGTWSVLRGGRYVISLLFVMVYFRTSVILFLNRPNMFISQGTDNVSRPRNRWEDRFLKCEVRNSASSAQLIVF
jgi:hypothetical protein